MRRWTVALGVVAALLWGCQRAARVEQAWEAADAAYEAAATGEEKVAVLEKFLDRYPDTPHTADAVESVVYHLAEEAERPAEADAFIVARLARIRNPERRREVAFQRLALLARLERRDELRKLAEELSLGRALTYREAMAIGDAASRAGEWELALRGYTDAQPYASEDAVRAENAGTGMSDERMIRTAQRRISAVLTGLGWAEANLGRLDQALQHFALARRFDHGRFLGNTNSKLGTLQGRTLLLAGRLEQAMQVLAPEALFGDSEEAVQALREAYVSSRGSAEGFDAFLEAERQRLARPAVDFTLPDYQGVPHTFSALRNGEVALLTFWFPT